jgi:hypothetical protein
MKPVRQRGSLTVWFTDDAIAAWAAEPRTTRGGQAWYSPLAILTALTLRAVFRLAYRQTAGLIGSIISLLGLTLRVPDHTTLSRRSATLAVPRLEPTAADGDAHAVHLLVDSTGLKLCGAGEWLVEKHGTRTRRCHVVGWRGLVHFRCTRKRGSVIGAKVRVAAIFRLPPTRASTIRLEHAIRPRSVWSAACRAGSSDRGAAGRVI